MSEGDEGEEADTDMLVLLMAMQSQVISKRHFHSSNKCLGSWHRNERPSYDATFDDERLEQQPRTDHVHVYDEQPVLKSKTETVTGLTRSSTLLYIQKRFLIKFNGKYSLFA